MTSLEFLGLCEEDLYLKELVRYRHLNPIRAKIVKNVKELESYPYRYALGASCAAL